MVLPGFVIAELSVVGRAKAQSSDLELVLRALFYALLLHLAASPWTASVKDTIGPVDEWDNHLCALIPYVFVVLVAAPIVLGSLLGWYLRTVEKREKPPGFWYSALGARDQGDAWDNIFQRVVRKGTWIIVELKSDGLIGGKIGKHSAIGQSPSKHDLYIEEIWTVDDSGVVLNLAERVQPVQGQLLLSDEIRWVRVLNPPYAQVDSTT
jgi:hypothetical protein